MSPSEAISSVQNHNYRWLSEWLIPAEQNYFCYLFYHSVAIHYCFRVTKATAKLWLLHACPVESQMFDSVLYHKRAQPHHILTFLWPFIRRTAGWLLFSPLQNTSKPKTLPEIVLFLFVIYFIRHSEQDERRTKERFKVLFTSFICQVNKQSAPWCQTCSTPTAGAVRSWFYTIKKKKILLVVQLLPKCKLTHFINKCLMNNKLAAVNIYTHYSVVFQMHYKKRQTSTFLLNPESTYTLVGHKHRSKAINTFHRFLANYPSR